MPLSANALVTARKNAGMSQRQLSKASGLSQQLISQMERGLHDSTKHIFKLAAALKVAPGDLDPSFSGFIPSPSLSNPRETLVQYFDQMAECDQLRLISIAAVLLQSTDTSGKKSV